MKGTGRKEEGSMGVGGISERFWNKNDKCTLHLYKIVKEQI